jgi:hypothetical protein
VATFLLLDIILSLKLNIFLSFYFTILFILIFAINVLLCITRRRKNNIILSFSFCFKLRNANNITGSTAQARAIREVGRENKVKATTAIPPNILPKNVTAQVEVITDPRQNEIPRRVKVLSRNIDTTRHRTILVKVLSRQSAAKPPHNLLPLEGRGTMLET